MCNSLKKPQPHVTPEEHWHGLRVLQPRVCAWAVAIQKVLQQAWPPRLLQRLLVLQLQHLAELLQVFSSSAVGMTWLQQQVASATL